MKLYKIDGEGWRRLVAISNRCVGQPWQNERFSGQARSQAAETAAGSPGQ